ncbi:MAG: DUF2092 domain-containing protein [Mesorhizobium sp.]|nr:DUF2092 domain-containing protein [Mesorhizobium sp.]MBL8576466.1 DUF2092 domain-containing protein [Mesorhizobium sp.]
MRLKVLATMLALVATCGVSRSQDAAEDPQTTIDPAALAALEKMNDYVSGLDNFQLDTSFSFDLVAGNGQTVTIDGTGKYIAQRPDKLSVKIENDLFARDYFYDGKTLTVVAPEEKYYASHPAKPTIHEMLDDAAQKLGVQIPLADLFDLGTDKSPIKSISSAFYVGTGIVNGSEADHYALQGADRNWEIWIAKGDQPLPVKVAIVDPTQDTQPRYVSTAKWTVPAVIAADTFTFTPSADHKSIAFAIGAPRDEGAQ